MLKITERMESGDALAKDLLDGMALATATQRAMDSVYNLIDKNRDNEDKNCGIPIESDLGLIV